VESSVNPKEHPPTSPGTARIFSGYGPDQAGRLRHRRNHHRGPRGSGPRFLCSFRKKRHPVYRRRAKTVERSVEARDHPLLRRATPESRTCGKGRDRLPLLPCSIGSTGEPLCTTHGRIYSRPIFPAATCAKAAPRHAVVPRVASRTFTRSSTSETLRLIFSPAVMRVCGGHWSPDGRARSGNFQREPYTHIPGSVAEIPALIERAF